MTNQGQWSLSRFVSITIWISVSLLWVWIFWRAQSWRFNAEAEASPYRAVCAICGQPAADHLTYTSEENLDIKEEVFFCSEHIKAPPKNPPRGHTQGDRLALDTKLAFMGMAIVTSISILNWRKQDDATIVTGAIFALVLTVWMLYAGMK